MEETETMEMDKEKGNRKRSTKGNTRKKIRKVT
jgi:hypothetical protein